MVHAGAGNNIEDGVTIDFGLMTGTTYYPETGIASILPGSRWRDVYADVEKRKFCIVCLLSMRHINEKLCRRSDGCRWP